MLRHTEVRGECNQSLNGHDGLPSMVGTMGRRYRVVSSEVKSRSRSEAGNYRLGMGNSPTDVLNPEIILSRSERAAFLVYVRGGCRCMFGVQACCGRDHRLRTNQMRNGL